MYIWELDGWPNFKWNANRLLPLVSEARHRQGLFLGKMQAAGIDARLKSEWDATSEDVLKSSAIEGEVLDPASVRSVIARRLGIPEGELSPQDHKAEGAVTIILDATKNFELPLTVARIHGWHAALFPTGYSGMEKIDVAQWRSDSQGPMRVVSNIHSHRPKIHFQAPPAMRVPHEMAAFIDWFNSGVVEEPILRAGIAHLWFLTVHPLDDGNGRIARVIADLAIAQAERTGQRFYSLSSQIERDKRHYYDALESAQKGDLEITAWLEWFMGFYTNSITAAEKTTQEIVQKAKFWQAHAGQVFSERQSKMLSMFLDGYEGHITTRKWASACRCSQDTAQRDINDLLDRQLLVKNAGGSRNTSYRFNWSTPTVS